MEAFKLIVFMVVMVISSMQIHGTVDENLLETQNKTIGVGQPFKIIVVGGTGGSWMVQSDPSFYNTWKKSQEKTIKPGVDYLVFNFQNEKHTVAEVSTADYESCTIAKPIKVYKISPANIILPDAKPHNFICTIGDHCKKGQKMSITALGK